MLFDQTLALTLQHFSLTKINKFKMSAPTWKEGFELPNGLCYVRYSLQSWIYLKKHVEKTDNLLIRIYVNKTTNRITFKIKT